MPVYVVEDNLAVLDSLVIFLEGYGHKVVSCRSAECFFNRPLPGDGDTVIVELGLKGIHGTQVIRWVRELKDSPKVLALSGQALADIEEQMQNLSEVQVIRKPLTEISLIDLV